MRSVVMLIVVLVALVGGFALFMLTQRTTKEYKVQTISQPTTLPRPVAATQGDVKLGTGNEVWIQGFNKKTGELTNEFRADRYDPPVGNKVHVIHPDSRFYQNNGTVMTVTADDGDMVMAEGAKKKGQMEAISNQPPQNGVLHHVTLGLLDNAEATVPSMTATLPILAFDNDTLRMNTIDWPNGDLIVPADQVPVVVRGRDYDFDGQGLVLRYNQRDQRLEFLQVAHGKRLLIKNMHAFDATPTTQPAETGLLLPVQSGGRPLELADADPAVAPKLSAEERERHRIKREAAARAATRPVATRPARRPPATTGTATTRRTRPPRPSPKPAATKPAREPVAYRAHFEDDVRIKEGNAPIGNADQMFTTFMSGQNKSTTQPSTQPDAATVTPATGFIPVPSMPAAASAIPVKTAPHPHTAATQPTQGTDSAKATPSMFPTTRPNETQPGEPIEITWTGKLTVEPEPLADANLRSSNDRIVEFFGRPAHLQRQGASVDAPYVWAGVEGNRFRAVGNQRFPQVTLKNQDGSTLVTPSIESDGDNVTIRGTSVAESMIAQSDGSAQKLVTHWNDIATLHLITTDAGTKAIDQATFKGNVDVLHPQLHLKGDALALGFIPEAGKAQPTLNTVHVDGHVDAAITGDDGNVQTITSRLLDLATATQRDGSLSIRQMHANGDVIAKNPNQTLMTDDLVASLLPSTGTTDAAGANTIDIDHLTAAGNVRFSTADGNSAKADTLKLDKQDDLQLITLIGTPASVTSAQSRVTGNLIKLDSTGSHANIPGAGTMDGVAQQQGSNTAQPVKIAWAKSMDYDAKANRAKILGDVVIKTRGSDGAFDTATGQILDITLADSAQTTQPAATAEHFPATQSGMTALTSTKKTIKTLTLSNPTPANDGVEVSSLSYDANDATKLIKRTNLFAPLVTVDTNADGSLGAVTVPSGGRMLYEDRTAPAEGATTRPATAKGSMAIYWKKRMVYDPSKQSAVVEGDVLVLHQVPGEGMTKMLAPRLIAELESSITGQSQLKQVTADQGATFIGKSIRFDAATAIYQPQNDRIIAQGTPRQPVEVYDESGLSSGSFSEMWWNMKTNAPERMVNVSAHVNHVAPPQNP